MKQLAADRLRSAILLMRFKPGDRLVERELQEEMGVSRTLIREILTQLEAEGLVQIIPHKGPIVARYTREEAISIYELRAVLEAEMGRLFTERATIQERADLKATLTSIRKAFSTSDQLSWLASKTSFYETLLTGARNPFLAQMLRLIHGRVTMLRATTMAQPGRLKESFRELETIVSAAMAGDADATAGACRAHVENAGRVATGALPNA
ncbi:MAG: GntR family transcriptional regulator [Bosea sp. (in: a-proteobacteria)]